MTKSMAVFIHTNPQQMVGAKLAAYALRKHSRHNDQFDVQVLNLWDFPHLTQREGQTYRRKGRMATWRNRDLQSFSPLRFLPPQLMNYQGRAVLIDPDIFALADIHELLSRDMQGKALWCRKGHPEKPTDQNYNTSVMLLDCAKLRHWDWDRRIDDMFAHKFDYGDWIFLRDENPAAIGELEAEWNHWDTLTDQTKLLHNTERSTQPWKTGLPVDYNLNYQVGGWRGRLRSLAKAGQRLLFRGDSAHERYLPHPDQRQERLFFTLLRECLDHGVIDEKFLKQEIRSQHLRPDALRRVRTAV
jgi:hypothetical protein